MDNNLYINLYIYIYIFTYIGGPIGLLGFILLTWFPIGTLSNELHFGYILTIGINICQYAMTTHQIIKCSSEERLSPLLYMDIVQRRKTGVGRSTSSKKGPLNLSNTTPSNTVSSTSTEENFFSQPILTLKKIYKRYTKSNNKNKRVISLKKSKSQVSHVQEFNHCLKDRELRDNFEQYLTYEFSNEHLSALIQLESFAKTFHSYSSATRKSRFIKLINLFVKNNSVMMINISYKTREAVLKHEFEDEITQGVFDEVVKELRSMLFGAFLRYRKSPLYPQEELSVYDKA